MTHVWYISPNFCSFFWSNVDEYKRHWGHFPPTNPSRRQALDAAAAEEPSLVTVPVAAAAPQSVGSETVAPAVVTPAPAEGKDRMEWNGWVVQDFTPWKS